METDGDSRVKIPEFPELPEKVNHYKTIVADPPWPYNDGLPGSGQRGADSHYDTLPLGMIKGLGPFVSKISAGHSHLYLWATNSFLDEAYDVCRLWGFEPKTTITWVKVQDAPASLPYDRESPVNIKERIGMGHYYRNTTEHLVFAQKGSLGTERNDVPTHLFAERTEHSRKPDKSYVLVEEMSPGPYFELFARRSWKDWDVWGNEVS